jgi:type I restriction-modification system DNA methylase subunit
MIQILQPQIYLDGTFESCCDCTIGTGGFLINYMNYIIESANTKK